MPLVLSIHYYIALFFVSRELSPDNRSRGYKYGKRYEETDFDGDFFRRIVFHGENTFKEADKLCFKIFQRLPNAESLRKLVLFSHGIIKKVFVCVAVENQGIVCDGVGVFGRFIKSFVGNNRNEFFLNLDFFGLCRFEKFRVRSIFHHTGHTVGVGEGITSHKVERGCSGSNANFFACEVGRKLKFLNDIVQLICKSDVNKTYGFVFRSCRSCISGNSDTECGSA